MEYVVLKAEIKKNNLSVSDIANLLNIPSKSILSKLCGKTEFTLSEIEFLADIFDCSLDYLAEHRVYAKNDIDCLNNCEHKNKLV